MGVSDDVSPQSQYDYHTKERQMSICGIETVHGPCKQEAVVEHGLCQFHTNQYKQDPTVAEGDWITDRSPSTLNDGLVVWAWVGNQAMEVLTKNVKDQPWQHVFELAKRRRIGDAIACRQIER